MTAIVRKHYGVVDKFVGDEIMGLFEYVEYLAGKDAENTASCALKMISEAGTPQSEAPDPV